MDPIRPTQAPSLLDALRKLGTRSKDKADSASTAENSSADAEADVASLRKELAALVAHTDPDVEASLAAVRLPLLRSILQREWGAEAAGSQEFANMVGSIDQAIANDPQLLEVVRAAVVTLKAAT